MYADEIPGWFDAEGAIRVDGGDGRMSFSYRPELAAAIAVVLTEPGHEGRSYDVVTADSVSMAELAAAARSVTGDLYRYDPHSDAWWEERWRAARPLRLADRGRPDVVRGASQRRARRRDRRLRAPHGPPRALGSRGRGAAPRRASAGSNRRDLTSSARREKVSSAKSLRALGFAGTRHFWAPFQSSSWSRTSSSVAQCRPAIAKRWLSEKSTWSDLDPEPLELGDDLRRAGVHHDLAGRERDRVAGERPVLLRRHLDDAPVVPHQVADEAVVDELRREHGDAVVGNHQEHVRVRRAPVAVVDRLDPARRVRRDHLDPEPVQESTRSAAGPPRSRRRTR